MRIIGEALGLRSQRFLRLGRIAIACAGAAWLACSGAAFGQSRLEQLEEELKARLRAQGVGRDEAAPPVAIPRDPAIDPSNAGYLGVIADDRNETRGVRVLEVVEGGPGAEAGLRKNDLIVTMDGRPLTSMDQLSRAVDASFVGQQMTFEIVRDGRTLQRMVTLTRRPPPGQRRFDDFGRIPETDNAGIASAEPRRVMLGVRSQTVKEEDRTRLRLPSTMGALVVSVAANSPAAEAGLAPDDVIVAIDGYVVNRPSDLTESVQKLGGGKDVLISYYRNGRFSRSRALLSGGVAVPVEAGNAAPPARVAADELPPPAIDAPRIEASKPAEPVQMGAQERIELLENLVGELLNRVDSLEKELQAERAKNGSAAPAPPAPVEPRGNGPVGPGIPGEPILNPAAT